MKFEKHASASTKAMDDAEKKSEESHSTDEQAATMANL